jgi:uncharacterized protein (DUF2062 family)
MLFRSREKPSLGRRMRLAVWPRHSWRRSLRYFAKRVLRLSGSPHAVAAGVAAGLLSAFTPFIGFHLIIAFVIAYAIGGNMLAAGIATTIGNPLTIPFIWATTYGIGNVALGRPAHFHFGDLHLAFAEHSWHAIWPIIWPMTLGALVIGVPAAVIGYAAAFYGVGAFRELRRERLEARRRARDAAPLPAEKESEPT